MNRSKDTQRKRSHGCICFHSFYCTMSGRAQGGRPADLDPFYDGMGKVLALVKNAHRRSKCDDWNYALLMQCDARRQMCQESISALQDLMSARSFKQSFTVKTSLDDIKAFQERVRSAGAVETQAFCMICARALFENHRFFDSLEFTYQALKLILVDIDCVFPRCTRPVFDKIAGNFKTLWALCKVTQTSAFAENVETLRGGAPDQFVDISGEVRPFPPRPFPPKEFCILLRAAHTHPPQMFRLTNDDITKKCSGAAVAKTTNDGGDQDIELDTCDAAPCHALNAAAAPASA